MDEIRPEWFDIYWFVVYRNDIIAISMLTIGIYRLPYLS